MLTVAHNFMWHVDETDGPWSCSSAIFICRGLFNITFSPALPAAVGKPNRAAPEREKDRNDKKKKKEAKKQFI